MNKLEFIEFLLTKKKIDKDVLSKSKNIDDCPEAYRIMLAIDGSDFIRTILNPKSYGEIDLAAGDLKKFSGINKLEIKEKAISFINDLVIQAKLKFEYKKIQSSKKFKNNLGDNTIVGIDLGTTNTLASIIENGKAISIPMKDGKRMLPSVISINKKDKFETGFNALRQQVVNPKDTFFSVKRFIGRRSSEFSPTLIQKYPFKINLENDKLGIFSSKLNKRFECEELSAQVLISLKENIEQFLDKRIKDCILTVPAYFDHNQRVATKKAASIAGLNVKRLISEPTAAAFAYGISKNNTNSVSLVLDLGGGTFDISLVRSEGDDLDAFTVVAHSGDRDLGGDDYTNSLIDEITKSIKRENKSVDLNLGIQNLIRDEVNKAKHLLSFQEEVDINFPVLPTKDNQIFSYSQNLKRVDFEKITKEFTNKIKVVINDFLNLEKVKKNKIDRVVLVGGASRMPLFVNLIEKLTKIKPQVDINPDEVISHGAAYCAEYTFSTLVQKTIIDVTPLSLGIQTQGDVHSVIIPANTSLPTRKSQEFTTTEEYQNQVTIKVYQGNRMIASDNIFLNSFLLSNIQKARAGVPKIEVSFQIDMDGIMTVTARDKLTNSKKSIQISNSLNLTEEEIKKMQNVAVEMSYEDSNKKLFSEKINELSTWKTIFDDIENPKLSKQQKNTIERVEKCLNQLHDSNENPDDLITSIKKIIEIQKSESFANA